MTSRSNTQMHARLQAPAAAAWTLIGAEWLLLLAAVALFTISEDYHPSVPAGLASLAASMLVRMVRTHRVIPITGIEAPLALFVLSAGLAAMIAYDPGPAWLQFSRVLAGAALFYAVVCLPPGARSVLAGGFILAAAGLAIYWPSQHDFSAAPVKFAPISTAGQWLNAHLPPLSLGPIPDPTIHANVAAGTLVLAIPFALAMALRKWGSRQSQPHMIFWGLASLLLLAGLLLTGSRGAWLGLAGSAGLAGLVFLEQRLCSSARQRILFWSLAILGVLAIIAGLLFFGGLDLLAGTVPGQKGQVLSRLEMWQGGLQLAGDYAFTGTGLGTFRMVHAIYGILIHSPYIDHAHNTYLEVWIEQGFTGLLALAWAMLVVAQQAGRRLSRPGTTPLLGWAALFALAAAALHGLVDVVFYVERTLPLVGFVAAFAMSGESGEDIAARIERQPRLAARPIIIAGLAILLALAAVFHRSLLGALSANLGALEQTRVELSRYDPAHFENPTMDQVRQAAPLDRAIARFEQALAWDPANRTASQRLAAISLSRGDYVRALALMEAAWQGGDRSAITRLLLGDALAADGQSAAAAEIVRGQPWAVSRLNGQAWYRYYLNGDLPRAASAWEAALLLDPTNANTVRWLEKVK